MAVSQSFDFKKSLAFDRLNQFVTDVQSHTVDALGPFAEFEVAVRQALLEVGKRQMNPTFS